MNEEQRTARYKNLMARQHDAIVKPSKFQQYHCDCYRCMRPGNFLVLRWYLWIQGYKKRDTLCSTNRSRKCYSDGSGSRYATSRSHDKRPRSQTRCSIKGYS
ncbi:hypothetical protein CMV_027276 [Castanea mollissima]|uniref:Uncharacterized protein n=1 Tax=Castanea mollissima TaxID=60419 RepID=A0A8J4QAD2_9ROSI|nr:hypothetical protein CMV_027276 [Castanea mollissima]